MAAGRQETLFYQRVAPRAPDRYAPLCFEANAEAGTEDWHIILEDLTDTHRTAAEWPLPLSRPMCERIVETHASHQALIGTILPLMR